MAVKVQYLFNPRKPKHKAHIWIRDDTICRMASTGGLKMDTHEVFDDNYGRDICHICNSKFTTNDKKNPLTSR